MPKKRIFNSTEPFAKKPTELKTKFGKKKCETIRASYETFKGLVRNQYFYCEKVSLFFFSTKLSLKFRRFFSKSEDSFISAFGFILKLLEPFFVGFVKILLFLSTLVKLLIKRVGLVSMNTRIIRIDTYKVFILIRVL